MAVNEDGLAKLIDMKDYSLMSSFRGKYIDWLKKYYYIGGMPEVVASFIEPLKAYIEFSAFKLFLLDVGLLAAMSDLDAKLILEGNTVFTEFKGALTEQYVLQQLVADTEYVSYYFTETKSEGEIDFMVQKGINIIPVEVKAEENLRAKSLKVYCEKYKAEEAIRTSMSDYKEQEWMTNIPLWAIANL